MTREEIIATLTNLLASVAEQKAAPPENLVSADPESVEMLTIKECCTEVKGLNEYTVRQLVKRNEIPFVRCGQGKRGKVLIPKSALINYLNCASGNTTIKRSD